MKKLLTMILSAVVAVFPLSGCGNGTTSSIAPTKNNNRLNIVTTIFPQYDFAREIVGTYADATMLLPPGTESHTYEPAPQDIITIQNCDLFIYVGGEGDVWIDDILDSMGDKAPDTLKIMDSVTAVEEEVVEGMESDHNHHFADEDEHGQEHEHDEIEYDEHVWTSPANAIKIVHSMTDVISTLDSANAETYRTNANAYIEKLTTLDNDFHKVVKTAKRNTIIVGDRFPFRYFADEFGLNYYAAFPGCSSETEASAATVAFLTDKVKAESIPAVLYIEFSNHKIADSIAETTGAKTLLLHSCHNVSKDEMQSGVSYLSLMEKNIETIRQALN
ncbi:metal ABC transporter substrate-binding protein [Oscillospiraceae bacterium LTW-04]|nr:metal ABC transporter substrate-binding protein [Oscillospiraceae bacterium MB24-C1]